MLRPGWCREPLIVAQCSRNFLENLNSWISGIGCDIFEWLRQRRPTGADLASESQYVVFRIPLSVDLDKDSRLANIHGQTR